MPVLDDKKESDITGQHKIFGSTLEDLFVKNEESVRSLLASAARYDGGEQSWSAFFAMVFEAIKFIIMHPAIFFEVVLPIGIQILNPESRPKVLSDILATEPFKEFIKKPENSKVVADLAIELEKIKKEDREKFQKAAAVAFHLLSDGQDRKISDIPAKLVESELIEKDSTAEKILNIVPKYNPNLTVKGALDYLLENSKAFSNIIDSAKPLVEELSEEKINIKGVLKGAADLLEARARAGIFGEFLKDTENTKKMLNEINNVINKDSFALKFGASGVINNSIVDGIGALPVALRKIADTKSDLGLTGILTSLGVLAAANKPGNYVFVDTQDIKIFKSGFKNGGLPELKKEIKKAGLDWKYPEKNLHNIYFPKDIPLTNFRNSYMKDVSIIDATFKDTDFEGPYFHNSKIESGNLEGGNSKNVVFYGAEFEKMTLKDIKFQARDKVGKMEAEHSIKFKGSILNNVTFRDFNFKKFECDKDTQIKKLEFIGGKLDGINVKDSQITEIIVKGTELTKKASEQLEALVKAGKKVTIVENAQEQQEALDDVKVHGQCTQSITNERTHVKENQAVNLGRL